MSISRRQLLQLGGITAVGAGIGTSVLAKPVSVKAQATPSVTPSTTASTDTMPKLPGQRHLGNLVVSSLGLGCQGLGQAIYGVSEPSQQQAITVVRQAYEHGLTLFDTAEAYGPFKSEAVVGKAVKPFRNHIKIATKYGWDIDPVTGKNAGGVNSKPEHIKRAVDGMLKRLQTDRIDLLYQHRADPDVPVEDVIGVIQDLMKQGKVLGYGLCEVSPQTIRKAHKLQPLTAVQSEYSLLFRGREKDVLPVCQELGIGFVPWSPLGMGTLAGYVNQSTQFGANPGRDLRAILPRFEAKNWQHNMQLISLIRELANAKLCTPAQLSLAWLQAQYDCLVPIPGTTKSHHLMENLGADGVKFTVTELAQFRTALDNIQIIGDRLPEGILKFSEVR